MKNQKPTIELVKSELKKIDPNLTEDQFLAGQFLLSSGIVGTNVKKIAAFMGVSPERLRKFGYRARGNKIWVGRKIHAGWFQKDGGVALLADICVLEGTLKRTP